MEVKLTWQERKLLEAVRNMNSELRDHLVRMAVHCAEQSSKENYNSRRPQLQLIKCSQANQTAEA
jgi:uncharacterized protein YpbB